LTALIRSSMAALAALLLLTAVSKTAAAQTPLSPDEQALGINLASPDFTLAALPTTLRMPSGKWAFRITHRFARPIAGTCPDTGPKPDGCGGVGAFIENFFGFDSAARTGFELRYGLMPGTQLAVHRTNDRAIQLHAQTQLIPQATQAGTGPAFSLDVVAAIEGQNNFREDHAVSAGAILSHQMGERGAVFVHPTIVFNANPLPDALTDDNHTVMLGLGGRVRLGQSKMYLVAEAAPRLAGFKPGVDHISFAFEHRSGGHMFQINVSNALGTTLRQVALGGPDNGDWYIGFNLSRRFF
jgi:hypothetical protein